MTANNAPTSRRAAKLADALAKATLPALLLAVAPLATGSVLFSVLMGPTEMQPGDVAAATADSLLVRAAVTTVGLAALAPAVIALGRAELGYLRWLPIPTAAFWATRTAVLLLLDLPFALFWSAAAGPASGFAALTLMAAFHASLLVRGAGGPLLAALACASLLAFPILPGWSSIGGVAVLAVAVPLGWRRSAVDFASPRL